MAVYYARLLYNANGGSGAPSGLVQSSTTPHVLKTFTISSTKPSRTYFNFLGWGSTSGSTSASYASGGTLQLYTATEAGEYVTKTLYAVWQHQTAYVYYNANGGSGAPSTQSHWAGYSVTLSATIPTRTGYNFLGWATSASATSAQYQPNTDYQIYTTVTLYAVWQPASSKLSTTNGTLGTAQTISITRYVNTYTDTITYSFGSATGTIATKTNAGSVSWTPPTSLATQIPNSSTGTCTLTCTTYNGNTVVGTSSITITLTVPQSLAPTVSVSYADTIAKCIEWGLFVQSRSRLAFSITASGQQGASIASYSASVNGSTYTSATFTTGVLLNNGSNSYSITVTDSRGLKTVSTGSFSVVAYSNPSLTLTLCDRNDSDSEQVDIGFDFAVSPVSNNNDAKYRLDYKLKSASTWTNGTVQSLGAYSGSISDLIANLDGGDEWDIRINVIDSFQTSSIESEVGVSGNILLNSRHQGGLGILMKSQADNQLDIGKPTVHHGAVLEQFGSTVATHSASGNYAKVVTFGSNVTVGKNMLDNSHPSAQNTYNIVWGGPMSGGADGSLKLGAGTYTVSASEQMNGIYIADTSVTIHTVYNNTKATFTLTAETSIKVKFYKSTATNMSDYLYQLEAGSEATPYEPYVNTSDINVNAPITLEYVKTGDTSPTTLTIAFNRDYTLQSFTKNASADAYLVNSATARWDLYIGKNNSSDSVNVLDFHNPWSNSDMTVDWEDSSVSTLPTGAVSATQINTVITERGTTGSWRYRKWSDGRIEIWGVPRVTFTLTTVGVYHRGSFTFDLPFTLSDLETLQMTAYHDTLWYSLGQFSNGKTITAYGYDVADASNYSTYVSVYAVGTI